MQWIPRQYGKYILTPVRIWVCRIFITLTTLFIAVGGSNMFENIPEIYQVIAMCAVVVIAWIGVIQYSEFTQHIKKNIGAPEAKLKQAQEFAVIPYLVIPVLFGAVSVIGGLFITDYAIVHGYVAGTEEICACAIIASVVANCILDKGIVSHIGDTVYFRTIENKVVKKAEEFPGLAGLSDEDKKLIAIIKAVKNQ